jgi:nitrogen fixation NifU-like protein
MSNDFDQFVEQLQQQIFDDAREIYSDKVIEEFRNPGNLGRMAEPDVQGLVHGWCGDTMELYLRIDGTIIEKATFVTDGCGATIACGNMLTKMVQGKSLDEAEKLRPKDVFDALDGLPDDHAHCAELAINTLQNALFNWRARKDL